MDIETAIVVAQCAAAGDASAAGGQQFKRRQCPAQAIAVEAGAGCCQWQFAAVQCAGYGIAQIQPAIQLTLFGFGPGIQGQSRSGSFSEPCGQIQLTCLRGKPGQRLCIVGTHGRRCLKAGAATAAGQVQLQCLQRAGDGGFGLQCHGCCAAYGLQLSVDGVGSLRRNLQPAIDSPTLRFGLQQADVMRAASAGISQPQFLNSRQAADFKPVDLQCGNGEIQWKRQRGRQC